jgi:hypothetical protein
MSETQPVPLRTLHAELTAEADSAELFARMATEWLTEARNELFGGLSAGLQDDQPPLPRGDPDPNAALPPPPVLGPPGGTWATLLVRRKPNSVWSTPSYSARNWRRLLSGLAKTYPYQVTLFMMPLDDTGRFSAEEPGSVTATVAVHRSHSSPRWVRFEATAGADTGWSGSAAVQRTWCDVLKSWATRFHACYGHITDDAGTHATALERAVTGGDWDPPLVPRCHEVLRGYSWVTICASELAARLGGAGALAASGAFDEVIELPEGQVFLRATPTLEEYQGESVRRVFQVLAPVLLTGRPNPDMLAGLRARLVMDADAADYQ